MALITRSSAASPDAVTAQFAPQISGLLAGAAIDAAAPCYIASDGLVYMTNATAADAVAAVFGFASKATPAGQAVTLFGIGTRYRYGSGLTPGTVLYAGATAGRLDNAATTGDAVGCAVVITDSDIVVTRSNGRRTA